MCQFGDANKTIWQGHYFLSLFSGFWIFHVDSFAETNPTASTGTLASKNGSVRASYLIAKICSNLYTSPNSFSVPSLSWYHIMFFLLSQHWLISIPFHPFGFDCVSFQLLPIQHCHSDFVDDDFCPVGPLDGLYLVRDWHLRTTQFRHWGRSSFSWWVHTLRNQIRYPGQDVFSSNFQ